MPFVPPPFLLPTRSGDRPFIYAHSPWHQGKLCVPQSRGGRVRLEMTIPWIGPPGPTSHVVPLVLVWPKLLCLPAPSRVAHVVADALQRARPCRTRGPGLDRFPLKLELWRGEVITRKSDRALLPHVLTPDVLVNVREDLSWASRLLYHRLPSYHDQLGWVYHAYRLTALLVADEIARRYFTDRASLGKASQLEAALPRLFERINDAYPSRTRPSKVTPRRLALALVDQVLGPLFLRLLLDPGRLVGLTDAKLWNQVLPPENRKRLKALLPAESVHALLSWSGQELDAHPTAKWFLKWWSLLLNVMGPYAHDRWLASEPSPVSQSTGHFKLLAHPGVEDWAAIVWDALHS